ncbi:serine/threonine protein kinase [Nannizzia gypsea CBS 118893]|uniref:EKC/KEOPS complex subunit BUD32 n=1 Tax=Arthroderma gypseum (strain ATCC MYA-4604 / CBS 118893) TaxID=535722 RepID=E4UV73_ARTGP|nr:serine/threonine protein kinase [Nannizzia gypsea CBS 118893]EFR02200.1 serine/threonine protein kinase [Nannizzia gypsea CBS 118893]
MIPPKYWFFVNEGMLSPVPIGPCTWEVIDWDRSRWLQIRGPKNTFPEEEDYIEDFAARYANQLGEDEQTLISNEHRELVGVCSMTRHGRSENVWRELHILKALRENRRFIPFHRIVLDEVTHNILGFTSQYIAGGTLEHYRGTFYFRWLKQLTDDVDDLNLRYGIMHQDLAPRNILIDPATQDLLVFDFDRSGQIGGRDASKGCDDVDALAFTIYETLTLDESFRERPPWEQDVGHVESMTEWRLQLPLEDGVDISVYRGFIAKWANERRTTRTIKHFSEASEPVSWPEYAELEMIEVPDEEYRTRMSFRRKRKDVESAGGYVTRWERPPQQKEVKEPN